MNVCKERGVYCELATDLGFCPVTGCIKQNRANVEIIPTVTVTDSPMVEYAPIVRCKDCKHNLTPSGEGAVCDYDGYVHKQDWFCADGVRKNNE